MIRFHKPEEMEVLSDEEHQTQMKTSSTSKELFNQVGRESFFFLNIILNKTLCDAGFALNIM